MPKDHRARRASARTRRARLALVFALVSGAALLLAACGGGGGGGGSGGSNLSLQSPKAATRNLIGDTPTAVLLSSASARQAAQAKATVDQQRSYAHQAVNLSPQHSSQHRGSGVTVAVADTGIEVEHPDLRHSFYADPPIVRQGRRPFNPARDPLGHNFIADDEVKDDAYKSCPEAEMD